jgi:hypothetical protein
MRLFFMNPKQTHGLLLEWCDGDLTPTKPEKPPPSPLLPGAEIAWFTGVVADATEVAAWFSDLAETATVVGEPAGPQELETTVDLRVGDITMRLVTPRSPDSRYAPFLADGPRLHSFAVRVPDLDAALATLAEHGVRTSCREGRLASTDPADTFGLRIDWTQ